MRPVLMLRELIKRRCHLDAKDLEECPECTICLTEFSIDERHAVRLKCNETHIFHLECLKNWAHQSYTCPVCR